MFHEVSADDTWLNDNDCTEHVLPLPAVDTLDSTTRDRFQLMQQVESQWQEAPALTARDAHAPPPFKPGENDDADCFDHEIDPWLREPLEFVPDTGIPLRHLGVFLKKGMTESKMKGVVALSPHPFWRSAMSYCNVQPWREFLPLHIRHNSTWNLT